MQLISSEPHLEIRFDEASGFLHPCTSSQHLPGRSPPYQERHIWGKGWYVTMTNLVIDAFVEQYAKRPPICPSIITFAGVDFGSEICQRSGLARQDLARYDVGSNIL